MFGQRTITARVAPVESRLQVDTGTDQVVAAGAPAPPDQSVAAVRAAARLSRLMERAAGDLGLAHYRILAAVADGEGRASRVAERLALGRPTVSAAVESLCRQGYVERREAPGDLRAVDLRRTPSGAARLDDAESRLVAALHELCRRTPDGAALTAGLATLGPALDELAAQRLAHKRRER
jgi:DNA-binding MarR family transcriptional regulator